MSRPKVFISSTFYDLKQIRENINSFIKNLGYDPILHEKSEIPYDKEHSPEEDCYKEIENCDLFVSIIGGKFGTKSNDGVYSISQKEFNVAHEFRKQIHIFIERNVYTEFYTYLKNKHNPDISYNYVDDSRIYLFIEEILSLTHNNAVFGFSNSDDIVYSLKSQWAGLFQRLLSEQEEIEQINTIKELNDSVKTLGRIVTFLSEKNPDETEIINDILSLHHPAYTKIREILKIRYRVYFINYIELNQLLLAKGYKKVKRVNNENNIESEWYRWFSSDFVRIIIVSNEIFNQNKELKTPMRRCLMLDG